MDKWIVEVLMYVLCIDKCIYICFNGTLDLTTTIDMCIVYLTCCGIAVFQAAKVLVSSWKPRFLGSVT